MANASKNIDLFEGHSDDWRKKYWKDKMSHKDEVDRISEEINTASVTTVLKKRNLEKESKDFFQAQLDMTKDFLPKETTSNATVDTDRIRVDLFDQQWHRNDDFAKAKNEMTITVQQAYDKVYPHGNPVPVSPNTKPTSSIADDHKGGYRGDDGVPQGRIGTIQLEEKSGASSPIGDNYLPDTAWKGKDKVKMPISQVSSGWDAQKFDDGGFQVQGKKCNASENPVSINVGSLVEQAINKTNKNMNDIDMSSAIASTKEKKVLNKPFKTPNGKAAYAVYVKNEKDSIIRVDFDACQASDPTNIGPVWTSEHWGSLVNTAKAEDNTNHATKSLDQLSDFYYEKPVNPKNNENWDGYSFYSQKDILAFMPSLKLMPSVYTLNVATNKGGSTPSDTKYNSAVKTQLDSVAEK